MSCVYKQNFLSKPSLGSRVTQESQDKGEMQNGNLPQVHLSQCISPLHISVWITDASFSQN